MSVELRDEAMEQLSQIGRIAQANFVTVQKVIDYAYLEDRNMVSLAEAVGVREVSSRVTPAGPAPSTPVS